MSATLVAVTQPGQVRLVIDHGNEVQRAEVWTGAVWLPLLDVTTWGGVISVRKDGISATCKADIWGGAVLAEDADG